MAYSEKLSDTIALGKCEVHYTKSIYSFCIIIAYTWDYIILALVSYTLHLYQVILSETLGVIWKFGNVHLVNH